MNYNRQLDSDINPRILDVSKYNLGRYRLLVQHPGNTGTQSKRTKICPGFS